MFSLFLCPFPVEGGRTGHIIGGNMTGLTTLDLTTEFETAASLRPEKSKVCLHFSLRMPQGHDVDDLTWNQIAVRFMEKMNLSSNRPWLLVKHPDEHVHIATSRIDLDGNVWHGKFEALKAIKATHELEQEFHLKLTPTLTTTDLFKTRLTDLEIKKKAARSESELLPREKLAEIIANAIESSVGSFKCFTWHLQQSNVSLRLNRAKNTDHVSGISFVYNGLPYKGSKIARAYSYQGILKLIEKKKSKTIPGQNRPAFFGASPTFPNITAPTPVAAALETIPASSPMPSASIPEIPAVIPKSSTPPVVSIVPILPILQPTAISPAQRHPADEAIVVVANPAVNIVEPTNTPIPTIVQPVSIPRTIQTLQDIDPKLWRHDANSWPTVQKMLIEQLQLDPELISDLFIKGRLWFTNGSTLATARLALPVAVHGINEEQRQDFDALGRDPSYFACVVCDPVQVLLRKPSPTDGNLQFHYSTTVVQQAAVER